MTCADAANYRAQALMAAGVGTGARGPAGGETCPGFRLEQRWLVLQIAPPWAADYGELKGFKMQDALR